MFIEFEVYKGSKVCVNVNTIESIYVYNQLTYIRSSSGGEVATEEPYESVVEKIKKFIQGNRDEQQSNNSNDSINANVGNYQ